MLLLEKLDIWCFSEGLEVWLAYARVCVCVQARWGWGCRELLTMPELALLVGKKESEFSSDV